MRISSIELHHIQIPFRSRFQHALSDRRSTEAVIVVIRSDGAAAGYGEILPRKYLTGETIARVWSEEAPALAGMWLTASIATSDGILEWLWQRLPCADRAPATFSGFELATLDLAGKLAGLRVNELLELPCGPDVPAGIVIGFEVPTSSLRKHCTTLRLMGKRHVKVKVGRADDLQRLDAICEVLRDGACIRIDANGAWTAREAVDALLEMRRFDLHSVEQPVHATDLAGMRYVREQSGIRVMADESLCTLADAHRLIDERAADIFNIRLGKCGGFLTSLRLVELARAHGLGCHMGSLVGETGVLSSAAEMFVRSVGGFDCLEGKGQSTFLLEQDVCEPAASPAERWPSHGFGAHVRADRLEKFKVSEPLIFRAATSRSWPHAS